MARHAAFIYTGTDGSVGAIGNASIVPLREMAEKSRVSGMVHDVPIERGVVLADWRIRPDYRFAVDPAVRESVAAAIGKKSKKAK